MDKQRLRTTVLSVMLTLCTAASGAAQGKGHALTEVYQNPDFQLTGITVSKSGRIFVNFPRWSDHYLNAVVEVMPDGKTRPFPDEDWNRWDMKPATAGKHFVCVQSVVVDDTDALWVIDPAAPSLISVVPGGAKLLKIDLKTNQVSRVFEFGPEIAITNSYLNDVRVDTKRNFAYMTDSGAGGIVVLNLATGKSHRALDGDAAVMADMSVQIVIDGKPVLGPTGQPPSFNSDGIALSPDGEYLFFQALTGAKLYRAKTDALREEGGKAVAEKVADTFPLDGMWMDHQGRLYLSNLQKNGVTRLLPDGNMETLVTDPRLQWPDTFSEGPDGSIYISSSHINESPTYNKGKSTRKLPYMVFKFKP